MKSTRTILHLALLLLGLYACDNRPFPHAMQVADSLANTAPDSAITLLQQIEDSILSEPEATRVYYDLLRIKAQDKAYVTHTSDSIIRQVVCYYRKEKDEKNLPKALYYAGRVYRDLGDTPQALEYFQRVIETAKGSTDHKLLSNAYSQIGMIFLYQDIYDKAPEMFRKAYHHNALAKDSIGMVYRLRDIGRSYSTLKQADSAIHYYRQADKQAERIKNLRLRSVVNSELSGYYTELGRYEEAYKAMQIATSSKRGKKFPLYAIKAQYYEHTNQPDSAIHYYSQLLFTNNYIYKQGAYWGLYNIARSKGKINEMLTYLDQYLMYTDSVQNMNQVETIRKINALYDYQLSQKENRKLKIQTFQERRLKVIFCIAFVFSILLFIAYREYHKRKEQAKRIQRQKLERIKKEQYQLSLAQIEKNKKEIEILEFSLREAETTQNQLQQDLLNAQKKLIEKNSEQIEARQKVQDQAEAKLKQSEIYKKFHSVLKGEEEEKEEEKEEEEVKINNTDWQTLNQAIDETYNQFSQRLQELYPITDIELKVCLLLKINLSPLQIATISTRSKQAISSIRKRLYKKFFNEEGSTEQWDNFIQDF